jgi:cytochrome c oxidase subunit 4
MISQTEIHEHQHTAASTYVIVWAALLAMLVASIALGRVPNHYLMNVLVFGVAIVKALLVVRYFMGVRFEPWLVTIILLVSVFFLIVLFVGVAPDVSLRTGWNQ